MQNTSKYWKESQEQLLTGEGFVELEYKVSDPDLPDTVAEDNNALTLLSQTFETVRDVDRAVTPYATLEQNMWCMDGSKVTVPNAPGEEGYGYSGYIGSSLCNANGLFDANPLINVWFSEPVTILPGLTITWSEVHRDYSTRFKVTAYKNKSFRASKIIEGNDKEVSVIEFEITDFDEVEIEILEWKNPFRRARIGKIFLGIHKVYEKTNLLSFSCSESVDPLSAELPKCEISFALDNRENEFNPTNPEGLTQYLMERQEIRTRYGFRVGAAVEWIPGGVYYLSDWSATQNGLDASFKARDLLGFMNATYYKGKFETKTLFELAEAVLTEANLPKDRAGDDLWEIHPSLQSITTTAPLPVCSMAECLQLIANAAQCTIFFDRDGKLHIEPLENRESKGEITIDDDHSYSKAEISLAKPIKQVDVSMYSYTAETAAKELYKEELILNPGKNEFLIEYSDIAKGVEARASKISGTGAITVAESETEVYAKFCKLVLNAGSDNICCEVIIEGIAQKSTETIVSVQNTGVTSGETQPLKNTLITNMNHALAVGDWLKNNLNRRKRFTIDWRIDPRLDAGDIVTIGTGGNQMRVDSSSFSFNGAFKGKSEGVEVG